MTIPKMQLVDWLDDLCVRFIINLPQEELESVERICFQVEEAQWFYEDFIRPLDPNLPSLNLRSFALLMFQHCPLLAPFSEEQHLAAFNEFLAYKVRVPVRGAILLDEDMEACVLVKGWKKSGNWSFPRGKINKDEDDLVCAIREVYEETGYDIAAAGLVPPERSQQKYIEVTMREQHVKLFVFRGVSIDTIFIPRTRKEISKVQWFKLADLPGYRKTKKQHHNEEQSMGSAKLYMVAPFLQPLKKWIMQQRKLDAMLNHGGGLGVTPAEEAMFEYLTGEEDHSLYPVSDVPPSVEHKLPTTASHALVANDQPSIEQSRDLNSSTAAELKRILSVGRSPLDHDITQVPVPVKSNVDNLLAMLRQGSKPLGQELSSRSAMPKTPFEQVITNPVEPPSPHYHHSRHPPPGGLPPPPVFPISPGQLSRETEQLQSSLSPWNNYPTMPQTQQHSHPRFSYPTTGPLRYSGETPGEDTLYLLRQPLPPFAQRNDTQFARSPAPHNISVPSASQLPTPRLSAHAQSLLSAFGRGGAASRTSTYGTGPPQIINAQHQLSELPNYPDHDFETRSNPLMSLAQEHIQNPKQESFRTNNLPVITRHVNNDQGEMDLQSSRNQRTSTQQEALLKLFQKKEPLNSSFQLKLQPLEMQGNITIPELAALPSPPANGLTATHNFTNPNVLHHPTSSTAPANDVGSVEIAAMTSPKTRPKSRSEKRSRSRGPSTTVNAKLSQGDEEHKPITILQRERQQPVTSASLPVAPIILDIDTLRSNGRQSKGTAPPPNGEPKQSPKRTATPDKRTGRSAKVSSVIQNNPSPQQSPFHPVQILKRPTADTAKPEVSPVLLPVEQRQSTDPTTTSRKGKPAPHPKSDLVSDMVIPTANAPEPFQPQLLRRPKTIALDPLTSNPNISTVPPINPSIPVELADTAVLPSKPSGDPKPNQAQTLLSLFSKESPGSHKPSAAAILPVSPTITPPIMPLGSPAIKTPLAMPLSTGLDHKSSLLSLLKRPTPTPTPASASSNAAVTSPNTKVAQSAVPSQIEPPKSPSKDSATVSPLHASSPRSMPISAISSHRPSISATATSPIIPQFAADGGALGRTSRLNSAVSSSALPGLAATVVAADAASKGKNISQSDRGFLLNFLKGL